VREPEAGLEQTFLARILQHVDWSRPGDLSFGMRGGAERGQIRRPHRRIGRGCHGEVVVSRQLPRHIIVGLPGILRVERRGQEVHRVVTIRLIEAHHIGAGGIAAVLQLHRARSHGALRSLTR
jgi:hypothetical protein